MAASSVCSEHKSRVIEPRNIQIAGAFVFMSTGAVPERQMPSAMVRPGSKSRANVRKGSLGTWEILLSPLLLNQKRDDTGRTTTWHTGTDLATGVSKRAKHQEVSMAERNEAVEMDRGSRSALIVAPESRETDPRKPVSSQGGRRFYGTATGKHGMNSESFRNVLTRQWRIATGRKTVKPRNRMPETGASGSVGAPLEESGALPGNGTSLRASLHLFRL